MTRLRAPITNRDHVKGPSAASITLVEYGDYQCPYCGQAYDVLRHIERRFGKTLRFVFRNFPLPEIHPQAVLAAEAAEAADAQGKFWEMHDMLYENQHALDFESLLGYATVLSLDVDRVRDDMLTHRYLQRIQDDFMGGVRSGVNGTPCFFINGVRHDGRWDLPSLSRALETAGRETLHAY